MVGLGGMAVESVGAAVVEKRSGPESAWVGSVLWLEGSEGGQRGSVDWRCARWSGGGDGGTSASWRAILLP